FVGAQATPTVAPDSNLGEFINQSIHRSREAGYSLQDLRARVLERLSLEPPDHVLVVELEAGLRQILQAEISLRLRKPVVSCVPEEVGANPAMLVGAQITAPAYLMPKVATLAPATWPCIPLAYSSADEQISLVNALAKPSLIGMASISRALLMTARSVLAP